MPSQPVNMAAVRASRERLAALARAHPELLGSQGPENRAAWESTLAAMEDTMAEGTIQVGFRMPIALVEKLDEYAAKMNADHPGMSYTRADAARVLITRGLMAVGMMEPKADAAARSEPDATTKPRKEPKTDAAAKGEPSATTKPQKGGKSPRKAK